jgi:uncharacterized protein YwgA
VVGERLPTYWAILYALYRLKRVYNSFELQKYLYLAKVNGNAPIDYVFVQDYYGPFCSHIKQEALSLEDKGYIKISFENGRVFEITEDGMKHVETFINDVPLEIQKSFDYILEKYTALPVIKLRDYVREWPATLKSSEEYEHLKTQLFNEIDLLLKDFSHLESNGNSLFLRGSIDYCLLVLKREQLDNIKKDILLTVVQNYLKKIMLLRELTRENPELLGHLCLNDLKEDFELTQEACVAYNVIPALFDDTIDLSAFIED